MEETGAEPSILATLTLQRVWDKQAGVSRKGCGRFGGGFGDHGGGFGDHGYRGGNLNCGSGKDGRLNKAKGRTLGRIPVQGSSSERKLTIRGGGDN